MSGQHTPGPWQVETDNTTERTFRPWVGRLSENRYSALSCGETRAEAEANARLIAAAPDLLEALEGLLTSHKPGHGQCCAAADRALDALAKATGAA